MASNWGMKPSCAAEVNIADYYRTSDAAMNRANYRTQSEIQIRGNHLLYHPKDDAAFIDCCDPKLPYQDVILPQNQENIPEWGVETLATALHFKYLIATMGKRGLTLNQRPDFLLSVRDALSGKADYELYQQRILRIVAEDEHLTEDELSILDSILRQWYGMNNCHLVQIRQLQFILRDFRDDKPVCFSEKQSALLHARYPSLTPLLHAERSLNGQAALQINDRTHHWHQHILYNLLWQHTEGAIQLARKLYQPGYELLRQDAAALPDYLSFKGINYYRLLGQEVPQSCLTALSVNQFKNPAAAAKVVRKQNTSLPRELRPLAPRCVLALGGRQSAWQPVKVTARGVNPDWPDASAVTLPMWKPALLGLQDEKPATVQAVFQTDLNSLEELLQALREEHGAAGCVLARMLRECDRVRPVYRDLVIPVYVRIAMHFEEDGVTVDYNPEQQSFEIAEMWDHTGFPIVDEALCKAPQLLHRLTLQLALLEKHGHTKELEQACGKLARVLNRSNLWPLIICQRELRGFSPQAILTLFSCYEGEKAPLAAYGEAMGMHREMALAAQAPEDELGEQLVLAAQVAGSMPATPEQKKEAAEQLLEKAREQKDSPSAADTIALLLEHGHAEQLLQWPELPPHSLQGSYAGNGLMLIRHHLKAGNEEAARKVLGIMQLDTTTNTTPAYRLACALLSSNAEQQAQLRKDALILALFHRHVDHRVYESWRQALSSAGEEVENLMKAELLLSDGRSAGITPAMARRYEAAGQWDTAAFCYEYLIAEGISTATPYGQVPDHAAIYHYRLQANACRAKAGKKKS